MVHHIVMWKFKPEVEDAKKPELKKAMAENLKSLVGKVPGLLTVDFVEAPLASSTHDIRRPHSDKISHKLGLAAHEKPFSDTL